jgi:hypothetical protein
MVMENIGKIYYKAYKTLCVYNMRVGYEQEEAPFYSLAIMSMPISFVLLGIMIGFHLLDFMPRKLHFVLFSHEFNILSIAIVGFTITGILMLLNKKLIQVLEGKYVVDRYSNLLVFITIMIVIHLCSFAFMLIIGDISKH